MPVYMYEGPISGKPPKDVTQVKVAEGVTDLEDLLFDQCSELTSLELPRGLTRIGDYTFHDCTNLKSVSLPESVKDIGWSAFNGCNSLERIDLPEGLERLGNRAFKGCWRLDPFRFPVGVIKIGFGLFDGCDNLHSLGEEGEEVKDNTNYSLGMSQESILELLRQLSSVGDGYIMSGEYEVAKEHFQGLVKDRIDAFGGDHFLTQDARNRLALVYDELNDLDEALSLYERVYKGFAASLGETHKSTLEVLGNLTVVHQQRGEVDVALTLALKALDGYRAEFGRGHILTLKAIAAVGEVHSQCEDWSTALTWFDDALKGLEDVAGAHDPETLSVCNSLAYVYQELGDSHYDTAISLYSRVFTAYSSTLNVLDVDSKLVPDFNELRSCVGLCHEGNGDYDLALACYLEALEGFEGTDQKQKQVQNVANIGLMYKNMEDYANALKYFERAREEEELEFREYYDEDIQLCRERLE